MDTPDLDSKLARLNALDETLRLFLADMMQHIHERQLLCCEPLSAAFRAFFMIHHHMLGVHPDLSSHTTGSRISPAQWEKSKATLDTATKMIVDVVDSHANISPDLCYIGPPGRQYAIRAALQHIYANPHLLEDPWFQSVEKRLRRGLYEASHGCSAEIDVGSIP